MLGISEAAESIGFRTTGVKTTFDKLVEEKPFPFIAHWNQKHFVVVYDIGKKGNTIFVADPAFGQVKYTRDEFLGKWASTEAEGKKSGVCLLLEPTPDLYITDDEKPDKKSMRFLFSYLRPHKKLLFQFAFGLLLGSIFQLIFPFLTQSIVDFGITNQDLNFIYLVLIAQLVLIISRTAVDFIRSWILLHISARVNISLISDFLIKLLNMPIGWFDVKMTGDLLQRIGDHSRIEAFLTHSTLEILFSFFSFIIFSMVLAIYNIHILMIFLAGSVLYALWICLFLRKRRELDFKKFSQMAENQGNIVQLIAGAQEIKLNNSEKEKRWEWEKIQAKLFKTGIKGLALNQYQQSGSVLINEIKNIVITFFAARLVITGDITLGMMLAIQYIIGQMNAPVLQMINFMHSWQDAKISMERLAEIHLKEDENEQNNQKISDYPEAADIHINGLGFQYEGPNSEMVLDDVNITIQKNKVTAIVGASGSGKTTLIKLLLGFYKPVKGEIKIGEAKLENIHCRLWRSKCGAVMQDGFIFSDTIAKNISVGFDCIDKERLLHAVSVANIKEFIESLPLRYNTKIGQEGHGLSMGQKQRILIARAVYKNPEFLFFDEATSALDANNEKIIWGNLEQFYRNRTAVVVAHRLSTVKNAHRIIVLDKGKIVETGSHTELTEKKGAYYELIKNQLELGN